MSKIFLIGGPGNISTTTIQDLVDRGETVGLFSSPRSLANPALDRRVRCYPGDRNDTPALETALGDFAPDIVMDFVCFTPEQARALLPLINGKVGQFVFVSTVDVYGFPLSRLPMRESNPWNPPLGDYAANKLTCEGIFQAAGSRLPLTIVRPAYSFGPPFVLSFLSHAGGRSLITRLRHGMPVLSPGDGTTLIHVSTGYDTGRMAARVAGAEQAIGRDYTLAYPDCMTHDDYIGLFAQALGVEPRIVHIPTDVILSISSNEIDDSLLRSLTRFNVAFSVERFQSDFPDFRWVMALEDWARFYINWHAARKDFPRSDETIFDDRLIAAWQRCLGGLAV